MYMLACVSPMPMSASLPQCVSMPCTVPLPRDPYHLTLLRETRRPWSMTTAGLSAGHRTVRWKPVVGGRQSRPVTARTISLSTYCRRTRFTTAACIPQTAHIPTHCTHACIHHISRHSPVYKCRIFSPLSRSKQHRHATIHHATTHTHIALARHSLHILLLYYCTCFHLCFHLAAFAHRPTRGVECTKVQ